MRSPVRIEAALRMALSGPKRHGVQQAIRWDDSQVSRFLSGGQGVVIDKIDALVAAVGFVLVTRKYLDAVTTLGEVG
ncbi:DNA-binding protein, partial [Burkholderia sp. SIMBA_019]